MLCCVSQNAIAMKRQCGGKQRWKAKANGYGDVLCLRWRMQCNKNNAVESSAEKAKAKGYVDVLCLRKPKCSGK